MAEFEGIYRSGASPKRREEVLERLRAGIGEKQIAADLGIAKHSLTEIIEGLRADGRLTAADPGGSA